MMTIIAREIYRPSFYKLQIWASTLNQMHIHLAGILFHSLPSEISTTSAIGFDYSFYLRHRVETQVDRLKA